jgi:hypothetical protein
MDACQGRLIPSSVWRDNQPSQTAAEQAHIGFGAAMPGGSPSDTVFDARRHLFDTPDPGEGRRLLDSLGDLVDSGRIATTLTRVMRPSPDRTQHHARQDRAGRLGGNLCRMKFT